MALYGGKNISDLLLELYEFPDGCDFCDHTLSILERYVPAMYTAHARTDLINQSFSQGTVREVTGRKVSHSMDEFSTFLQTHPFTQYFLSKQGGPVLSLDEIMSETEWKQTVLYNELYTQYGVVHDTVVRFYAHMQCISFAFANETPLPMEYRRLLNLVAPHLGNAFSSFKTQQQGVLSTLPDNMVLLTSEGVLRDLSAETAALFDKYYPSEKNRSGLCLPETVERWVRHEMRALHDGCGKAPQKLMAQAADSQLSLSLIRQKAGWLLLMEEYALSNPEEILTGLGLTCREAEVLTWIVHGKQNSDIALILNISTATVRKHVEHLLSKLHCETRGAAALLAMNALIKNGFSFTADDVCFEE